MSLLFCLLEAIAIFEPPASENFSVHSSIVIVPVPYMGWHLA